MTVLALSAAEITRFDPPMRLDRGEIGIADTMELLGLARRQVYRLLGRLREDGASGLVLRKRGRWATGATATPFAPRWSRWCASTMLASGRRLRASTSPSATASACRETLQQIMMEVGLWKDHTARRPRPYQPRYRRDCRGELVQVDGSKHWWFEDRGPQSTLLVFIDDATSELMHLEMVESESTFSYMRATRTYLERHGKPVSFYTEKHSPFRSGSA